MIDMIGKEVCGAVKAVLWKHIQSRHRCFHFRNPSAKEETLNSLHLVFPIHPASTIMYFKKRKKENFTLYITMFFFSLEHKF